MIKERFNLLICKILSLVFLIWVIVTVLHCVYVFPVKLITSEYLFFTISMFGIKVGSDRYKDNLEAKNGNM